jgi:hypothetical protein
MVIGGLVGAIGCFLTSNKIELHVVFFIDHTIYKEILVQLLAAPSINFDLPSFAH